MSQKTYEIKACWDDEAKVWYSESDIIGLHIEASSLEEFEEIMRDCAVELILTNHLTPEQLSSTPLRDLVPGILWQRPPGKELACA